MGQEGWYVTRQMGLGGEWKGKQPGLPGAALLNHGPASQKEENTF